MHLKLDCKNLEDVFLNMFVNKTAVSSLFNSACCKGAVWMCV